MKVFGRPQLETRDLGDALQFVSTWNHGWMDLVFGPILIAVLAFFAWRQHSVIMLLLAIVALVGLVGNRARGSKTVLRLSQAEVVVRGKLDGGSISQLTIPRNEITSMGWNAGGRDDRGGLFVSRGWARSYVLPEATEAQAREIIAEITGKFPGFPIDDQTWASLIWGDASVLMGLDEADPGETSSNANAS